MNLIEKFIYALQYEIERPKSYGLFQLHKTLIVGELRRKQDLFPRCSEKSMPSVRKKSCTFVTQIGFEFNLQK